MRDVCRRPNLFDLINSLLATGDAILRGWENRRQERLLRAFTSLQEQIFLAQSRRAEDAPENGVVPS